MSSSSHMVQVYQSDIDTDQNDSVTISMEDDLAVQIKPDVTYANSEEVRVKDETSQVKKKKKPNYAVFRMQLVSEVMDTKIVGAPKKKTVREDVSGMQSKLHKKIYVYQGYNYNQQQQGGYNQQGGNQRGGEMDYEGEDPDDRNAFVRLVFLICGVMLIIVLIATTIIYFTPSVSEWMRGTVMGLALFAVFSIAIMLISYAYCCFSCSRESPVNWCLNILVTICYCYVCGFICARYAPFVVLGALITTVVITLLCLGLAYTSFDFTQFILIVMVAGIALMVASLFCTILTFSMGIKLGVVRIVITIMSAVLASLMLIIEFQMILGGKSVELSMDEYVYGAYLIFTSIISIFLKLVRIINYFT